MVHDVRKDAAHLIGFTVGMALYGFYIALFSTTMWILHVHKFRSKNVTAVMLTLFVVTTAEISLSIADNYNAWIKYRDDPGPVDYFFGLTNAIVPTKDLLLYVGSVVADSLICWRLYVIWSQRKRILIAPLIFLVLGTVSGAIVVSYEYRQVIVDDKRYQDMIDIWTVMAFGSTILVNVTVTLLISGRLWWVSRRVAQISTNGETTYWRIINALIESGALYTVTMLTFIIIFACGMTGAQYMSAYIVPMIVAIVPTLIVLRINLGRQISPNKTTLVGSVSAAPDSTKNKMVFASNPNADNRGDEDEIGMDTTRTKDSAADLLEVRVSVQQASKVDVNDLDSPPGAGMRKRAVSSPRRGAGGFSSSTYGDGRRRMRRQSSLSLDSDDFSLVGEDSSPHKRETPAKDDDEEEPQLRQDIEMGGGVILPTLSITDEYNNPAPTPESYVYDTRLGANPESAHWRDNGMRANDVEMVPIAATGSLDVMSGSRDDVVSPTPSKIGLAR